MHNTVKQHDRDEDGKLCYEEFRLMLHEDDLNKVAGGL